MARRDRDARLIETWMLMEVRFSYPDPAASIAYSYGPTESFRPQMCGSGLCSAQACIF